MSYGTMEPHLLLLGALKACIVLVNQVMELPLEKIQVDSTSQMAFKMAVD